MCGCDTANIVMREEGVTLTVAILSLLNLVIHFVFQSFHPQLGVGTIQESIPGWVKPRVWLGFRLGGALKQVEEMRYSSKDG